MEHKSEFASMPGNEALDYLERGFSVFPLPHRQKNGRIKWKRYRAERASQLQVRKWFAKPSNAAIVTGKVSKLVVRDFDDTEKYRQWKDRHPDLASTAPTVATASGFHVYVNGPIPRLRVSGVGSGELRGSGGYVVAPQSKYLLFVLRELDKAGFFISGTSSRDTDRYSFEHSFRVIDLGLLLEDVKAWTLGSESFHTKASGGQ